MHRLSDHARTRRAARVRLTIALAGHPPPLLISPRRRRSSRSATAARSSASSDPLSISESEFTIGAGETLLLYTDGVIEAGRPDRLLGEEGLLELCTAAPGLTLAEFLEHIERAALDRAQDRLRDDIALLALRIDG